MGNEFFTADLHLLHKNILKFGKRPATDLQDMEAKLLAGILSRCKLGDTLTIAGDVSFGSVTELQKFLNKIVEAGVNIDFVQGNHDSDQLVHRCRNHFRRVDKIMEKKIDGIKVVICHYPLVEWNHMQHGSYHLFGHVHGKPNIARGRSMDIGVDARPNGCDWLPWSWEEIHAKLKDEPILPHGWSNPDEAIRSD